jgi:hypothetical protein
MVAIARDHELKNIDAPGYADSEIAYLRRHSFAGPEYQDFSQIDWSKIQTPSWAFSLSEQPDFPFKPFD